MVMMVIAKADLYIRRHTERVDHHAHAALTAIFMPDWQWPGMVQMK